MRWLAVFVDYAYSHSRVQFHAAVYALLYGIFMVTVMTVVLFILSALFKAFGSTGVMLDYETNAAVFGPVIFGELVRGHVKAWLRCPPEAGCLPAVGVAGLATGAIFGAAMTLKWGGPAWLELSGWSAGVAALYLLVGWLIQIEERKRRVSVT
jgi:hypothetical protein